MGARILVSDNLSVKGVELLSNGGLTVDVRTGLAPEALIDAIPAYDGLVVRSTTKVTADVIAAAKNLKLVGRAGIGVDNIDLDAATARGIVVMNTPAGSSLTVAEHTFAMLLAVARHIAAATASVKSGKWEKKRFQGRQLSGKTLGVIGIGNIGSLVVKRAQAFGMEVIAHDPFISPEAAAKLGVKLVALDEIWPRADVLSLHVPLTEKTRNVVNESTLAKMKPGAYIVNAARGGLIDEQALARALSDGTLGGAALDVFAEEPPPKDHPLLALPNFVCAPHLGASTEEAQEAVAVQLAEQIAAFFASGTIRNAVNVPSVAGDVLEQIGPWLHLAAKLGALAAQIAPENPTKVDIGAAGEVSRRHVRILSSQILKGLLQHLTDHFVNEINAPALAHKRGIAVTESRSPESPDYTSTIGIRIEGASGAREVVGTVLGRHDARIVGIDGFGIDAKPEGHLLLVRNEDVPGIVGRLGTILGEAGVNIAGIHLSRRGASGQAYSMLNIDSPAPADALERLRAVPHVVSVRAVHL